MAGNMLLLLLDCFLISYSYREHEQQEFGKLGHTTHAKATSTRIVAPPYHLSSEFGRYTHTHTSALFR
jgi:hypothetical protein